MYAYIKKFTENITDTLTLVNQYPLKNHENRRFDNILICGLGGSGISGMIVSNWFNKSINIPISICQDYDIPGFVNQNTLVVSCSYSGNTEETISATLQCKDRGAFIVGVTSGGELRNICEEFSYNLFLIPSGNPPRAQIAYSLIIMTHLFKELNLLSTNYFDQFKQVAFQLDALNEEIQLEAKEISNKIVGKNVIIYSVAQDEAIAIRFRQQLNENSKILCSHHVIPEMNHNELVGWAGGTSQHAVIFIKSSNINTQNQKRFNFTSSVIKNYTSNIIEVNAKGSSMLEESLYLINLLDYVSYFLAELRQVDSIEVNVIDGLKKSLK